MTETTTKTGRPSTYSPAIADEICRRIAEGESLRGICQDAGMPDKSTVMRWLAHEDHAAFRDQYARAREAQADHYAEEIIDIADDGSNDTYVDDKGNDRVDHEVVQRSRLRVDTRKFLMAKLAPKKYGDRVALEHTGKDGGPIETRELSDTEIARRAAFLLTKGTKSVA